MEICTKCEETLTRLQEAEAKMKTMRPIGEFVMADYLDPKIKELEKEVERLGKLQGLGRQPIVMTKNEERIKELEARLAERESVSHACDILWDECVKNKAELFGEWDCKVDGKEFQVRIQLKTIPTYSELETSLSKHKQTIDELKARLGEKD